MVTRNRRTNSRTGLSVRSRSTILRFHRRGGAAGGFDGGTHGGGAGNRYGHLAGDLGLATVDQLGELASIDQAGGDEGRQADLIALDRLDRALELDRQIADGVGRVREAAL